VVQAVLVYLQALQAHQFTMQEAVAVLVLHILLEVAVVMVAVVKALMQHQVHLGQGQEYKHKQEQLTLVEAAVVAIINFLLHQHTVQQVAQVSLS
jgi:hypothetical protein